MELGEACRAARAILNWSVRDLSDRSGVSWSTIASIEAGGAARPETAEKLINVFDAHGVKLIVDDGQVGAVRVRRAA